MKGMEGLSSVDYYTCMDNSLILSKQSMPKNAAKLLRLAISKQTFKDDELRLCRCTVKELATLLQISKNDIYRDIRKTCQMLESNYLYIGTNNPKQKWMKLSWVDSAYYDGKGTVSIALSEDIKPYILNLNRCYTQYQLRNILKFNSFYSIRIYEILKYEYGRADHTNKPIVLPIDYLREILLLTDKLTKTSDFKRKVIETAVMEINEKSDIKVMIEYHKTGKNITHLEFEIHVNDNVNNENSPINKIIEKRKNKN